MKKKTIIIILAVLSISSRAQYVTETVNGASVLPTNGSLLFVRDCPTTPFSLSYVAEDRTFYAFTKAVYTMGLPYTTFPIKKITLTADVVEVNDIYAVDSIAFFCGKDTTGTSFIGSFNVLRVGEINYPNANDIRVTPITQVSSLNKIKVFKTGGSYTVYAIGLSFDPNDNLVKNAIVEFPNAQNSSSYRFVRLGFALPFYAEVVDDIVFTQRNVVIIERDNYNYPPNGYIAMRKVGKTTGLASTDLNTLHYYPMNFEYNSKICATSLGGEDFAIAYAAYTTTTPNPFPVRVRTFNTQSMSAAHSYEYNTYEKIDMHGLIYNSGSAILTVLHQKSPTSTFVYINPTATSNYSARSLYDAATEYTSLDAISANQFIATSSKKWFMQENTSVSIKSCLMQDWYPVSLISQIFPHNTSTANIPLNQYMTTLYSRLPTISNVNSQADCHKTQ